MGIFIFILHINFCRNYIAIKLFLGFKKKTYNPHALLVGTQTGVATLENSKNVPQKMKQNYHVIWPRHFRGMQAKEMKTEYQRVLALPYPL